MQLAKTAMFVSCAKALEWRWTAAVGLTKALYCLHQAAAGAEHHWFRRTTTGAAKLELECKLGSCLFL